MKFAVLVPFGLLVLATLPGCPSPAAFREPVTKFQVASANATAIATEQFLTANKRERDAYIDAQVASGATISVAAIQALQVGAVLTPEDLSARIAAFRTLQKHNELMLELASSDAPERARIAAQALASSTGKLATKLNSSSNDSFTTAATAFGQVASLIAQHALNARINDALTEGVTNAAPEIRKMIQQLQTELPLLDQRTVASLSKARTDAVANYVRAVQRGTTLDDRTKLAEEIKSASDAYAAGLSIDYGALLRAMAKAHEALVEYAGGEREAPDLAKLVESIDAFASEVEMIRDSLITIRGSEKQ